MRVACAIQLTEDVRVTLESWSRGRSTPARLVTRAKIVLLAAEGLENKAIAARLQTARPTVGHWRTQFARFGIAGIVKDAVDSHVIPPECLTVVREEPRPSL